MSQEYIMITSVLFGSMCLHCHIIQTEVFLIFKYIITNNIVWADTVANFLFCFVLFLCSFVWILLASKAPYSPSLTLLHQGSNSRLLYRGFSPVTNYILTIFRFFFFNFYEFIWVKLMTIAGKQNLNTLRKCSGKQQFYYLFFTSESKGKT